MNFEYGCKGLCDNQAIVACAYTDLKWNHIGIAEESGCKPKPLTGWSHLAGSGYKTEEEHQNIRKLTALVVCNTSTSLMIYGNMHLDYNKLKIHPIGMAT